MIRSVGDYHRYLEADRIALGRSPRTVTVRIIHLVAPDYIWTFQRLLRTAEYFRNVKSNGILNRLAYLGIKWRLRRMSVRLGFTVPENVFGPGLAIVHYGTIIVNEHARVGANCRLHACTNIGASAGSNEAPRLGDNVYIAPGAKIFGGIVVASNTAIGANAVVDKSFEEEHTLIAGVPARRIKTISIGDLIPCIFS